MTLDVRRSAGLAVGLDLAPSANCLPGGMEVIVGVWQEAARCDKVAGLLTVLRDDLPEEYFEAITAVLREVESTSRLLRDFHDLYPIYKSRSSAAYLAYYLQVLLPCLCKTLRDMVVYLDNPELNNRQRWSLLLSRLDEQAGYTLAERFILYLDFLVQLIRLLSRYAYPKAYPGLQGD